MPLWNPVSRDGQNYFATVTAKPLASIERLRYVLLLWPTNEEMRKVQSISPADIRRTVQQRLENQGVEAGKVTKTLVKEENDNNPVEADEPSPVLENPAENHPLPTVTESPSREEP